jgi:hypothetical protein
VKPSAWWLLFATGCAGSAARFETADPHAERAPRRAPAVAVDPAPARPEIRTRGASTARLVVLASPRAVGAALGTVDRFFRALVAEAPEAVDATLAEQAFLDSSAGRQPARGALRARILQLDYTALRGVPLYGDGDLEVFRREDLEALGSARAAPSELEAGQLYVRVHLNVSHAGKTRLFADQMSFFLRPDGKGYRIAMIREDTPVP